MADESPSLQNLIEELGFCPNEHQFLLRLFGSSDPFAGLPGADIEANHSRNQSGQHSSTSFARRLASTRLWQDIPPFTGERANQARLRSTNRCPSDFREGSEGRDPVHYEEEWTSLIGTDSESLLSELLQQLATDEPHCPGSPKLTEYPKASENITRPGSVEPPSSSVYESETGEQPSPVDSLNESPGTQGNCETSQDPRTLNHPGSFEQLIESFPRPPGHNQAVRDETFSHVDPDAQRVPPKDSAQANTLTLANSQIKPATSLPRISRFSEDLKDSNPIGEQDSSNFCAKADTSALDTSGLGNTSTTSFKLSSPPSNDTSTIVNTCNISPRIPSLSPGVSFRDLRLPSDCHEGQQVDFESFHQAQEHANRFTYTIFPEFSSRVRPISVVIGRQHSFRTIFEGRATPTASPRYYQKTPLHRISACPASLSFASGKRSTSKRKRTLRRCVKKLKTLLCRTRKHTPSSLNH
ncbi:hypothetical protein PDIG_69680 [Penicillium digitatum PHI26]|uniref:Uncharacterized protein n=2 Tax=Penicillium digitatum TaxID=36651 RepID=K9FZW4_PEND2|nr:hypothetical protein PDIP_78970 [Penicillium digitatum Pd1]EKV06455.1 hypothetical protein PDIP_78970 [Penicillium digitatum Pd1]EKV08203.1 hypothetical protein PDIG_69680 [Penicillium digitatum PHI26]